MTGTDIPKQIEDLKNQIFKTLDDLHIDPSHDYKSLLKTYKQLIQSLTPTKDELTIQSVVPINNNFATDLISINALLKKDKSLYDLNPTFTKHYFQLKSIIKSINSDIYDQLYTFITENNITGDLEFYYHCLSFLCIIQTNNTKDAIRFVKDVIYKSKVITDNHANYIRFKKYLPFIIYTNGLKNNYIVLKSDCITVLKREFTRIFALSLNNVFSDLYDAGTDNIENLLNLDYNVTAECELPIELYIKNKHHSIFICPILKTSCENANPPIRLLCGHVISMESVDRMLEYGKHESVKCPYCPCDSKTKDMMQINL